MDDSVRLRLAGFPRERTWLLPALLAAQETEGWLSSEALTAVAEHVRVPPSETCAIATDYATFRRVKPGRHLDALHGSGLERRGLARPSSGVSPPVDRKSTRLNSSHRTIS